MAEAAGCRSGSGNDPNKVQSVRRGPLVNSLGGTLEAFYFAFGKTDVYVIVDLPDNASVAAAALVVNATGTVKVKTTVLMTPEEVDAATKKVPDYSPPGQ